MSKIDAEVEVSELSRTVTIGGVTVQVQIFRPPHAERWALMVVAESGTSTLWNDQFDSEVDALAAFHGVVHEEGVGIFLADDEDEPTVH